MIITKVKKVNRTEPWKMRRAYRGDYKHYESKPRLYISPVGETILDNLVNRHSRPKDIYKKLLPEIFKQAGLPEDTKAYWSQKAGCSCPCSPGFILQLSQLSANRFDVYAEVADSKESYEAYKVKTAKREEEDRIAKQLAV